MANLTPNLGLFKYDPVTDTNQVFSFEQALNDNWDILDEKCGNARNSIFDFKWSDHELDDMSWLRGDTFSWQSGGVYVTAYNHLVQDVQGITAETETIGSYTITFYRATDGHKICLADQEQTVLNIYNTYGIAWYYILDTTNTQFKLPRTKYGFEGLRNNVGDLIPQDVKLPNITGTLQRAWIETGGSGALYRYGNFGVNWLGSNYFGSACSIGIDASRSSSVYSGNGTDTNIQERATQMYLYFYVGDYTQTAIEQTAGLNSELFNGKADVNLANTSAKLSDGFLDKLMPDYSAGIDISAFTSSSNQFIAPCDGIINWGHSTANGHRAYLNSLPLTTYGSTANIPYYTNLIVPISKNETWYATGYTDVAFELNNKFFPLKGAN